VKKLRSWVTQVTIGSFLVIGVTGLLMFLGVNGGLIMVAHEWVSLIFVVAAGLHTWLNWSAVCKSLSRARGIIIVGFFTALLAISVARCNEVEKILRAQGHVDKDTLCRKAGHVLLRARISTVAEMTGRTPQQLRDILGRHGVLITTDEISLADAAAQSQVSPLRVLDVVLQDEALYQNE
jgi:hypothetical protein